MMHRSYTRIVSTRGLGTVLALLLLLASSTWAQRGSAPAGIVRGQVKDPSGAVIPAATVTVTGPVTKQATTNAEGRYSLAGLPAGKYTLRVASKGFGAFEMSDLDITVAAPTEISPTLVLTSESQQVTVQAEDNTTVSVDPSQNASSLVLKNEDLDALSDNPDDLQDDLMALAGPSAGPNGGQMFIDGFSNGRLPPKESIREIRVNQNPFGAEFDKLGFGRIEIFTKPGSDKFHGQAFFNFSDAVMNSRNPFSLTRPPYQQKFFGGNVSGPISKKASFFVDAERRQQDETEIINAVQVDPTTFAVSPYNNAVLNPQTRTTVSPRVDYQLNDNNTLSARYTYMENGQDVSGLSTFTYPTTAYNTTLKQHSVQATETAVLNAKAVNESRFQFYRQRQDRVGDASQATVRVNDAFTSGGSNIGLFYLNEDRYEFQNNTTITLGAHLLKFGGRLRAVNQENYNTTNFNGTFTFSSLNSYILTLQGLQQGLTGAQIRAMGGGASQFSLSAGQPLAGVTQADVGLWLQDDWKLRPNITLSYGLRVESQSNIANKFNWAPRIGIAWGVGGGKQRAPKTVIRGGFGMFYDRFTEDNVLSAMQNNGVLQQPYLVLAPNFYPRVPTPAELSEFKSQQAIRQIDANLHAPYMIQSAIGVERQLPKNITVSVNYTNTHGVHALRTRDINAPLPGTYIPGEANSGVRPFGEGNIYAYESTGIFNQHQILTNVNARINRRLTIFSFYVFNHAKSDTDNLGTFPANSYDLSSEYGPAQFDIRHRVFFGGNMVAPYGLTFSPFIMANTGAPFNITLGRDLNGDGQFTERPAFATDASRPGVISTPYGLLDPNPVAGEAIIPRNLGRGPGQFTVNMRVSRTWGFGKESGRGGAGDMAGMGGGGPRFGGGGGGGMRGGMGGRGGGMFGGGGSTAHRYNVTLSLQARNLFNHVNPGAPTGTITSPFFLQSTSIGGGGQRFGSATANRRLEAQIRFMF